MHRIATIFLTFIALTAIADDFSRFEGLAGAELADALRKEFAPVATVTELPIVDYFPPDWPLGYMPAVWPADGSRFGLIIPSDYCFGNEILDLYNIISDSSPFYLARHTYIPGNVIEVTESGKDWTVGAGLYGADQMTNMWMPALDRRGDLARRLMYLALVYPQQMWGSYGSLLFTSTGWPLLTTYGRNLITQWAMEDPVDQRELIENQEIAAAQGNHNPFVIFPTLIDYLWGEDAGQGYIPDDKRERQPLRSTYSRSVDGVIDLYSPYVDDDATWSFDSSVVDGKEIDISKAALGFHILSFTHGKKHGKLKIKITQ